MLTKEVSWFRESRDNQLGSSHRGRMCLIFLIVLIAVAHADHGPCTTPRSQAGFLKGVIDGLPESLQQELCLASSDTVTVSPDETGVSHFVLPGFIPKTSLGEMDEGWKLVTHEEPHTQSPEAEAAVMHLWLRAMCIGYGGSAASCLSCHSCQSKLGLCNDSLDNRIGLYSISWHICNRIARYLQRQHHNPRLWHPSGEC